MLGSAIEYDVSCLSISIQDEEPGLEVPHAAEIVLSVIVLFT